VLQVLYDAMIFPRWLLDPFMFPPLLIDSISNGGNFVRRNEMSIAFLTVNVRSDVCWRKIDWDVVRNGRVHDCTSV